MRITLLVRPDSGLVLGGGEIQARSMAHALAALGHEVKFLGPFDRDLGDVVHAFSYMGHYDTVRACCSEAVVPFVCSPIFFVKQTAKHRCTTWLEARKRKSHLGHLKRFLQECTWVAPNTSEEAKLLRTLFDLKRLTVVPNGVSETFQNGDPDLFRSAFDVRGDFLLTVGRVEKRKNLVRLAEALAGTDIPWIVIGRCLDSRVREACSRRSPGVRFLPPFEHDDPMLASAYAAAKVFAQPSLLETPGLAALEAYAAGANVVVTEIGGARDYFGEDTAFVDPYSTASIRAAVLRQWRSPKASCARTHFVERYGWKRAAERAVEVYGEGRRFLHGRSGEGRTGRE